LEKKIQNTGEQVDLKLDILLKETINKKGLKIQTFFYT
jgi:hypothetical protein